MAKDGPHAGAGRPAEPKASPPMQGQTGASLGVKPLTIDVLHFYAPRTEFCCLILVYGVAAALYHPTNSHLDRSVTSSTKIVSEAGPPPLIVGIFNLWCWSSGLIMKCV